MCYKLSFISLAIHLKFSIATSKPFDAKPEAEISWIRKELAKSIERYEIEKQILHKLKYNYKQTRKLNILNDINDVIVDYQDKLTEHKKLNDEIIKEYFELIHNQRKIKNYNASFRHEIHEQSKFVSVLNEIIDSQKNKLDDLLQKSSDIRKNKQKIRKTLTI